LAAVFAEQRAALTDLVTDLIARSRPDVAAELADTLIAALDGVLIEGFRKSTKAQRDEFITRALRTLLTSTVAPTIS
jgi:molybdopterin-guanine dinucleotide biosynthesis protein